MILRFRAATTWMTARKGAGDSAIHAFGGYLKLGATAARTSAATLTKPVPVV
jgi:hypothetical protein